MGVSLGDLVTNVVLGNISILSRDESNFFLGVSVGGKTLTTLDACIGCYKASGSVGVRCESGYQNTGIDGTSGNAKMISHLYLLMQT